MAEHDEPVLPELEDRPSRRKQTKKRDLQKEGGSYHGMVEFNAYGVPVGTGRNELRNYIGVIVRETVSIIYDDWRRVPLEIKDTLWQHFQKKFSLSIKSKGQVLKWMGVTLRNFRSELANEFVLPNKEDMKSLRLPPIEYPCIKKADWKCFVNKVLSEEFQAKSQKAKERRAKYIYNHHLGSTGYGGMLYRKQKETGISEQDVDRSEAWLMARADKKGQYTSEIMEVVDKINDLKSQVAEGSFKSEGTRDILSQAIQKPPNGSRVQGMGQFITPSMCLNIPGHSLLERERRMYQENFQLVTAQLEYMNARLNAYSKTEIGSSSFPNGKKSVDAEDSHGNIGKMKDAEFLVKKTSPRSVKRKIPKATHDQTPEQDRFEVTSNITPTKPVCIPRRSARLTPMRNEGIQPEEEPKRQPVAIAPVARKLVLKKNTRGAVQARQKDKSAYITMFMLLVENTLPNMIKIEHEKGNFGILWKSYIDELICKEIIDFKEVSNCTINLWMKHLYEEMGKDGTAKPVQFGIFEMIHPSRASFKDGPQYISKLLGAIDLGQVVIFPYNPGFHWVLFAIDILRRTVYYLDPLGSNPDNELMKIVNQGIRIHQSLQSDTRGGCFKWVSLKAPMQCGTFECGYYVMKYMKDIVSNINILKNDFKGIDEYTIRDISQVRDEWATYIAKLITEHNRKN